MNVYIFLTHGFEQIEALAAHDIFKRAKLPTRLVSLLANKEVESALGCKLICDERFDEEKSYEGLWFLPGGSGTENYFSHTSFINKLKQHGQSKKWIAAICAAPMILGQLGLLENVKATVYKGLEMDIPNYCDEKIVIDQHIMTAQGPFVSMEFAFAILEHIASPEIAKQIKQDMLFLPSDH